MPSIGRSFDDFARLAPQVDARGGGAFSAAGKQQPLQQHPDRRRREQRPVRPGRQRHPRPVRPDLARRRAGVPAGHRPLRRPPGRLHRRRPERHHPQRHQHLHRFGLLLRPQPEFRRQGPRPDTKYGTFSEKQYGFRLGGPIIKDKLFFFLSGEMGDRTTPTTYVIDDSGTSNDFGGTNVTVADADRFVSILKNKYGYDPGGYGAGYKDVIADNDKLFVRLDYNISDKHRLTLRHNYVNGPRTTHPSKASSTVFPFGDVYYDLTQQDQLHGPPAQQHPGQQPVQRADPQLHHHPRQPRHRRHPLPAGQRRRRRRLPPDRRHRAVLGRQRPEPGHHRDHRQPDLVHGQAHLHHRHPQRVLQVRQPLHPQPLRLLGIHQPRQLREGHLLALLPRLHHRQPQARSGGPSSASRSSAATSATTGPSCPT